MQLEAKQRLLAANDAPFLAKFVAILKTCCQNHTLAASSPSRVTAVITSGGGAVVLDQLILSKLTKLCKEFDGTLSITPRGPATHVTFKVREEDVQAKRRA